MDKAVNILSLTEFANSIVLRGRAVDAGEALVAPLSIPIGVDVESLHAALVVQAQDLVALRATVSAEIDTLIATIDRLEVEGRVRDGELVSVKSEHAAMSIEMARLRTDMTELGDAVVGRLVAEFDKRMAK